MYQALYRKYRPTHFNDVVGQNVIIQSFKNAIIHNKLSHAYLFTGPRGTGKTTIAKIIGKTLNCLNAENAIPCDVCVNCTQIKNKETTDIIEIDAASNNGVDEIRELKSKVNLVPSTGKYKVYIIDEVHMLTTGAFNALLKTLEEPPAHVLFILATTEPHKIPATILSRCQRFDFKKLTIEQITERLDYIKEQEKIDIEPIALEEIARLSDGGMRDSISLFDQVISYTPEGQPIKIADVHEINGTVSQNELKGFIQNLLNKDLLSIFNQFDIYNEKGKDLVKVTEEILLFLRNFLLYKTVPSYFDKKEIQLEPYQEINQEISITYITKLMNTFNNLIQKMKISNYPKMVFELAMIELVSAVVENNSTSQIQQKNEVVQSSKMEKIQLKSEENNILKKELSPIQNRANTNLPELLKLKEIRINNTLAGFQRKALLDVKQKFEDFRPLILNPDYNECATLILDGEIKAASIDSIIMVFEKEWISDAFNQKLLEIENLFKEVYNISFKVISCSIEEWNIIKQEFNQKKKEYMYMEENIDLLKLSDKTEVKTDIEEMFGDIIEYSS